MSRPRLNLYLDALAFLALLGTIVTGLVLRLALPPGSGRLDVGSPERPVATLWGFTRHEWGGVHYVVSLVLLVILALHLWLHRDWIASMGKRESRASGRSFALGLAATVALLVVGLSPLWSEPSQQTRAQVMAQRGRPLGEETICYNEGVALTAFDLERISGVPQDRFRGASAPLSSARTQEIIRHYYTAPATVEDPGAKLFAVHCQGCHGNPGSLPSLAGSDSAAVARLRGAKPAGAHQSLRALSDEQLLQLVSYLRAQR